MPSTLSELSNLIASSIAALEKSCADRKLLFPSLDDPFTPSSEAFRDNPDAAEAANIIAAAANQLMAMVLPPPASVHSIVAGNFKASALRVCLEANVTEILREGGPQGMHADEIAAKANVSSDKLARLLRYLATHHVYREIRPDVFVNNRISSMLDSGKSVKEIQADPNHKHDNTPGFAALAGHHLDEVAKASNCLWENMSDPDTAYSEETNQTPFNRAFNWPGPAWAFLEQADQEARRRRVMTAMQGVAALEPPDAISKAFDWKTLPKDSVVVDVGGGIGASSVDIAKSNPDIKVVIQDLPHVEVQATEFCKTALPEGYEAGRIRFEAHDFFTPQPIKNASVFLLKNVLHDWSDLYAVKILTHLREAANSDTRLIIIGNVLQFACHDPRVDQGQEIPGSVPREAPKPLLANYGIANALSYSADITMLLSFNSKERTINHLAELLEKTGWRLTKVVRDVAGTFMQPVEAVPII